ncbi:MAG: alpha/beta fold hydrolase [Pseudomonadota bacterium]
MTAVLTHSVPGDPPLAVDVAGKGSVALFLHGIGGNRTNWAGELAALSDVAQCAAMDLRGYGDSGDYAGPFTLADCADDVVRVLDHLGARRAHLCGLSLGGRVALHVAARHPGRVRSLALCDTHLGFGEYSDEERRKFVDARATPLKAGKTPADIAPRLAKSLAGDPDDAAACARLEASLAAVRAQSFIKAVEGSVDDPHPLTQHARVPTLVVVGQNDRITPPAMAFKLAARIPGADLAVLEGAGHLSNLEAPVAFQAALRSFWSGVA